jgi:hypothetical protein
MVSLRLRRYAPHAVSVQIKRRDFQKSGTLGSPLALVDALECIG